MVGLRAEDAELVTGILLCTVKEALSVKYTGDNAFFSGESKFFIIFFSYSYYLYVSFFISLRDQMFLLHPDFTLEIFSIPLQTGRYQEAAKRYSEALQLIESLDSESFEQLTLTVLLNRTGCNMKLSMWPDVIQDCIRGLAIHPKHPKFLQVCALRWSEHCAHYIHESIM